jgi:hypothetical protein
MNRANLLDSKADKSNIERERSVNVSSASVKNKVAVNRVAVNRAAARRGGSARRTIRLVLLNQQAVGGNSRRFFYVQTR